MPPLFPQEHARRPRRRRNYRHGRGKPRRALRLASPKLPRGMAALTKAAAWPPHSEGYAVFGSRASIRTAKRHSLRALRI
jgi:hypothetical protein